jgi:hypothetical protein
MSNKNPVNNILSRLSDVISISLSCQNKKTILTKKENNINHPEKPNSSAYRFDIKLINFIISNFNQN